MSLSSRNVALFVLFGRFLLSFERCVEAEARPKASRGGGVRRKGRRQILNGDTSRHSSALTKKKRKMAKSEPTAHREVNSAVSTDDVDAVVDMQPCADSTTEEKEFSASPLAADEDTTCSIHHQLDAAEESTVPVRCGIVLTSVDKLAVV